METKASVALMVSKSNANWLAVGIGAGVEAGPWMSMTHGPPSAQMTRHSHLVAAWLSGNALVFINIVALRRARLVLGWV